MNSQDVKNAISGVLVVDKPVGMTSHDVVQAIRNGTGLRRAGHTGTLDPRASLGLSYVVAWIDRVIVDGIVDGSATVTKAVSTFTGKFDNVVVDGLVNFMAYLSAFIGLLFRRFQTGKVQTYIIMVIFSIVILLFLFKSF